MKNTLLTLAITVILAGSSLTASSQQDKKAAKARKELKEAKMELREAKIDSAEDYQRFHSDAQARIMENDKKILELKAKKADDNKEIRERYDRQVLNLQTKNNELKAKMKVSASTKTDKWASFKREFNHDMNEFGRAFKDIGVNNSN